MAETQTETTLWLAASKAGWSGCPGSLQMGGDLQQSLRARTAPNAQGASDLPLWDMASAWKTLLGTREIPLASPEVQ